MFLPVMYDVNRRLQLMRATKGYVKRSGFGKHCRVISGVSSEQILRAMALKGENADIRELLQSSEVDPALKKALAGVLQATSMIVGSEGHRSQIRLRGHAAGWHYGTAHVFCTPNLADGRASLLLQLHCGPDSGDMVESFVINLDWESEQPQLPSASAMRRILASDPVSQAKFFDLMMKLFLEEVVGVHGTLERELFWPTHARGFEDGMAGSTFGGCFGDVAALCGPLETQGNLHT